MTRRDRILRHPRRGRPRRTVEYVTVTVAGQMLGLPIERVHDVFIAGSVTAVPLAPAEIAGLLNLRGRVVTAICLRRRLGLPDGRAAGRDGGRPRGSRRILRPSRRSGRRGHEALTEQPRAEPRAYGPHWVGLSRGVHSLEHRLLIILDIDAVLAFGAEARAA